MVPLTNIPLEVFELIADQVVSRPGPEREIKQDLIACRLTSRGFARFFEPYLFRSGAFTSGPTFGSGSRTHRRARVLLEILTKRQILSNHVKQFTLCLTMGITPPDLPEILNKLRRLERLEIKGRPVTGEIQWRSLSVPLKVALTSLIVEGPGLLELVIDQIQEVPADLILKSSSLTKIGLPFASFCYTADVDTHNVKESGDTAPTQRAMFDLDLSFAKMNSIRTWFSGLSNPKVFLGKMRSLRLQHDFQDDVHLKEIMGICGRHAELLTVFDVTFPPMDFLSEWLILTLVTESVLTATDLVVSQRRLFISPLNRLRSLQITVMEPTSQSLDPILRDIAVELKQMDTSSLEELTLSLCRVHPDELAVYIQLDRVLNYLMPKFNRLVSHGPLEECERTALRRFRRLSLRFILVGDPQRWNSDRPQAMSEKMGTEGVLRNKIYMTVLSQSGVVLCDSKLVG